MYDDKIRSPINIDTLNATKAIWAFGEDQTLPENEVVKRFRFLNFRGRKKLTLEYDKLSNEVYTVLKQNQRPFVIKRRTL